SPDARPVTRRAAPPPPFFGLYPRPPGAGAARQDYEESHMGNPLIDVISYGQSIWYDNIRRSFIVSGELKRLIDQDGLKGITSNPAIFEKAIAGSSDYEAELTALGQSRDLDAKALYERLAIRDIQDATDAMKSVYDKT